MIKKDPNLSAPAYESPYAEISPLFPETVLCLSGEVNPDDYEVIDYPW